MLAAKAWAAIAIAAWLLTHPRIGVPIVAAFVGTLALGKWWPW